MSYDLYTKFDVSQHVKTYFNYCEVVIDRLGKVRYATPSHQMMMLAMYGVKLGLFDDSILHPANVLDRHMKTKEVWKHIPEDEDVSDFLMKKLRCVCVYTDIYSAIKVNKRQLFQLNKLNANGACRMEIQHGIN